MQWGKDKSGDSTAPSPMVNPIASLQRRGRNRPVAVSCRNAVQAWCKRKIDCLRVVMLDSLLWAVMMIFPSAPCVVIGLLYKTLFRHPAYHHMDMDGYMIVVADGMVAVGLCGVLCDVLLFARTRFSRGSFTNSGGASSNAAAAADVVACRQVLPATVRLTLEAIRSAGLFCSGVALANSLVWIGLGVSFKPNSAVPVVVSITSLSVHTFTYARRLQRYFKFETVSRLESLLGETIDHAAEDCKNGLLPELPGLEEAARAQGGDPELVAESLAFLRTFSDNASLKPSLVMVETLSRGMVNSAFMLRLLTGIDLSAREFAALASRVSGRKPWNACKYNASATDGGADFYFLDINGADILREYAPGGLEVADASRTAIVERNGCFFTVRPRGRRTESARPAVAYADLWSWHQQVKPKHQAQTAGAGETHQRQKPYGLSQLCDFKEGPARAHALLDQVLAGA